MSLSIVVALFLAAQMNIDDAKRYFEAGRVAFRAGQYDAAAKAFREAYKLAERPEIAFSTAQALRLQYFVDRNVARLEEAAELYARYVTSVEVGGRREDAVRFLSEIEPILREERSKHATTIKPKIEEEETQILVSSSTPNAQVIIDGIQRGPAPVLASVEPGAHRIEATAEGHLPISRELMAVRNKLVVQEMNLTPLPGRVDVVTDSGASVIIDGRDFGETPLLTPISIEAGEHWLTVRKNGALPSTQKIDLGLGHDLRVEVPLESTTQRRWAVGTLTAGASLGVGSLVLGAVSWVAEANALELSQQLETGPNWTSEQRSSYENDRALRDSTRIAAAATAGVAVTLGLVGTLLYFLDEPNIVPRPERPASVVAKDEWVE